MAATQEDIVAIITRRLHVRDKMAPLVEKYGMDKVGAAIEDAALFYEGVEEIGTSDASCMVDSAVRNLGEPSIFKN